MPPPTLPFSKHHTQAPFYFRSMQTAIQLGYCTSVPMTDIDGVVTPNDMQNDGLRNVNAKGQKFVVKKRRIIDKIS